MAETEYSAKYRIIGKIPKEERSNISRNARPTHVRLASEISTTIDQSSAAGRARGGHARAGKPPTFLYRRTAQRAFAPARTAARPSSSATVAATDSHTLCMFYNKEGHVSASLKSMKGIAHG